MGGGIGQLIALHRPELLASLTPLSTSPVGGTSEGLPGPTPAARAYFDSPPPDPDSAYRASYTDWVVAGQRPFAGTIPCDSSRLHALAAIVHARSHDPAAANNHWLVMSDDSDDEAQH